MPGKIPLRPAERDKAEMNGIVLRNKTIALNQFVFAGGIKIRKEDRKPIKDEGKIGLEEYSEAAHPCFSGEEKPTDTTTVEDTATTVAVIPKWKPRWMSQASGKDDTDHEANARQTARTSLQKRFERMNANKPIRLGKPVTQAGLRRAFHRNLRSSIRRVQARVLAEDRRTEEIQKASDAGLSTDDLLEADRKRFKRESEKCEFEEKGEEMRDPLIVLYKPRRRTSQKTHQMRTKARNLRKEMGCPKSTDK